jgi:hypothetical protein
MEAAYNLGLIHENALLGAPDMNEAVFWYKLSSDHNPEARVAYNQIVKAMSLRTADINRIMKEYGTVYGLDQNGKSVLPQKGAVADPVTSKAVDVTAASPLTAADRAAPVSQVNMPVSMNDIPPLSPAESRALLKDDVTKDRVLLSQIQEQLVRLGLYPGPADGMGDPQTTDAIRTYQAKNQLDVTGKASEDLLVHMLATELNSAAGARE